MCFFILRQRRLQIFNFIDRFLYACMPWFTRSSVEHDGNLLGLTGEIFQLYKISNICPQKMNCTGLITTQTKFHFDPKMKRALISQFYGIVRDETLVPNIVLVCKYLQSELEALISELILKRTFRKCIFLPPSPPPPHPPPPSLVSGQQFIK